MIVAGGVTRPVAWTRIGLAVVLGLAVLWITYGVALIVAGNASGIGGDMRLYQEAPQRWLAGGIGGDMRLYQEAPQRWLAGGGYYWPYQLAGPYPIPTGTDPTAPVLYPPVALAFLVPASFLPAVLWYAIPLGVTAWIVVRDRPSLVGWTLIALCAAVPASLWTVVAGNPSMWVLMAVALSTRWRWVSAFVLWKPSVFPFALPGIRDWRWWAVVAGMGVVTLALLPLTLDWITAVRNATGPRAGLLYSVREVPLLLIPWIAWWSRADDRRQHADDGLRGGGGLRVRR